MGYIAEDSQDGVPQEGTEEGEQQELAERHLSQARRDTDKLADGRDKPTDEGGDVAVLVEVIFRLAHLVASSRQRCPSLLSANL